MYNRSFLFLLAGFGLVLMMAVPVSASLTTIAPGGVVFIGEEGLDISDGVGSNDHIAWWATTYTRTSGVAPHKIVEITSDTSSYFIDPAIFVGYTGEWYQYHSSATPTYGALVFRVADPTLSIKVWDFTDNKDVSGKSVSREKHLSFCIDTNMYQALNPTYRPNVNSATDGFITIKVRGEDGVVLDNLYDSDSIPRSLLNQYISYQPWCWGGDSPIYWGTNLMTNNEYLYPIGTYTVIAESGLNNMKNNYKSAGADYSGKTVSQVITITLLNPLTTTTTTTTATTTTTSTTATTTATTTTSETASTTTTTTSTTATTYTSTSTTTPTTTATSSTTAVTTAPTTSQTYSTTSAQTVSTTKTTNNPMTRITTWDMSTPVEESPLPAGIACLALLIVAVGILWRKE